MGASCDTDGFFSVDDDILITETYTAEDIVTEVKTQQNSASDKKNLQEEIEVNVPTTNEALQATEWCIIFMKQHQKMCN